jgi:hypothetical protein
VVVSREEVIWVYKIFLGREPESEDVIETHATSDWSRSEFIMHILDSEEFASQYVVR